MFCSAMVGKLLLAFGVLELLHAAYSAFQFRHLAKALAQDASLPLDVSVAWWNPLNYLGDPHPLPVFFFAVLST